MNQHTAISILSTFFIIGIFVSVGIDPIAIFADTMMKIVDLVASSFEFEGIESMSWATIKLLVYIVLVVIPTVVDIVMILKTGNLGITLALFSFFSGLLIVRDLTFGTFFLLLALVSLGICIITNGAARYDQVTTA